MSTVNTVIVATLAVIGLVVLIAVLTATPLWLLWNWLMPVIFGLKSITWLQALGLSCLSSILFKSYHSTKS